MSNWQLDSSTEIDRRSFLTTGAAATFAGASALMTSCAQVNSDPQTQDRAYSYQGGKSPWPISLDTATIGWGDLEKTVDVAHKTGFDAIEPWMRQLKNYEKNGGDLEQLGQQIRDRGMFVPSVIGLWDAIPTDPDEFETSMKQTHRELELAGKLGARQVQTIPEKGEDLDLDWAAEAYSHILTTGLNEYDIHPALVFVYFRTIQTLYESLYVAGKVDHPEARIIPDTYHMYLSDSGFSTIQHLNGDFIAILQFNDAPESQNRDELGDEDRLMPGDGILPLTELLNDLKSVGFDRAVSLEMYNPKYQEMDSRKAAEIGLNKTVQVIDKAMS